MADEDDGDAVWQARVDLATAYRACNLLGLNEGIDNHLTCTVPNTLDQFLVIPYGMNWDEVRPGDLLRMDMEGRVLEGEGQADTTAFMIHSRMHATMGQRGAAIFHTHMPHATALCCIRDGRLEMCHQNSLRYYNDIAYDREYNGLVFDAAEGDRMARVLGGSKRVLFNANHGVMVCGASVAEAMEHLYYLEQAAKVQVLAMSTGRPLLLVEDRTCQAFQQQMAGGGASMTGEAVGGTSARHYANVYFDALKRRVQLR